MGPFDEVLGGMRVGGSLYAQFQLRAPWGLRFSTGAQARLVVVARGRCWLRWSGRETPLPLEAGGCLIIKPGVDFDMSDAKARKVVSCMSLRATEEGAPRTRIRDVEQRTRIRDDGLVVEHGGDGEPCELIIGRFSFDPIAAEPLVAPMPPLVHVPLAKAHAELLQRTLALMEQEASQAGLGARFVVDRLTDALFVQAMRAFFSSGCSSPGWITALADRRVAKAIHAVHADLARPWTVAELASVAGGSRSSFAAAFTSAVGEPPLDYVTNWRVYRAKVLLSSTDESLAEIAARVGYDSDTALSRAFKRKVGVPPGEFRKAMAARTVAEGRVASARPEW